MDRLLKTKEVAKILGIGTDMVTCYLRTERLRGKKIRHCWYVCWAEIDRFLQERERTRRVDPSSRQDPVVYQETPIVALLKNTTRWALRNTKRAHEVRYRSNPTEYWRRNRFVDLAWKRHARILKRCPQVIGEY